MLEDARVVHLKTVSRFVSITAWDSGRMALWLAILGTTAAVSVLVAVVVVLRKVNDTVRSLMQRVLGDYFDYAAMFYVFALTILGLLGLMYFVVALWVWILLVLGVILSIVFLLELS
jgi:hypothetical protein